LICEQQGGQRAPHKPLLVLYALGRWSQGNQADIPVKDIDRDLTLLLKEFGPPRQSYHPEYPFWRLQNDGAWQVRADGPLKRRQGNQSGHRPSFWPPPRSASAPGPLRREWCRAPAMLAFSSSCFSPSTTFRAAPACQAARESGRAPG
jgi:hypothetical protein